MTMKRLLCALALCLGASTQPLAAVHGKIDAAPIYVQVKVKQGGRTAETLNLGGGRLDATIQLVEDSGFVIRPAVNVAGGDGTYWSGNLGFGYYIPVTDRIKLLPTVGGAYSHLHTFVNVTVPNPFVPGTFLVIPNQKEKFGSASWFLGTDISLKISEQLYVTGIVQYAWAHVHTDVGSLISSSGSSSGFNTAIVVDYYFCENWALSGGAAYNNSMSKEKDGISALGFKLGIGYYF